MCIAIHICFTWKGMIFYKEGKWLQLRLSPWIKKPLFDCPMCMASFWTIMYSIFVLGFFGDTTLLMILIVCGINTIFTTFIYAYHDEPDDVEPINTRGDYFDARKKLNNLLYGDGGCTKQALSPEQLDQAVQLQKAINDFEVLELKEKFGK